MNIDYRDGKLRKLCEVRREAEKRLGQACASKLRTRLADMEAADNVMELVAGHPHPLKGDPAGHFALDLADGKRVVFAPNLHPVPVRDTNDTDWSRVTAITILFIGDYHD